jgi:hypothetical protein
MLGVTSGEEVGRIGRVLAPSGPTVSGRHEGDLMNRRDHRAIGMRQAPHAARAIAVAVLGRDPGPMATAESISHHLYDGSDIVVKVIDTAGHSRLDREMALAACPAHRPHGACAGQRALPARRARASLRVLRPGAGHGSRYGPAWC